MQIILPRILVAMVVLVQHQLFLVLALLMLVVVVAALMLLQALLLEPGEQVVVVLVAQIVEALEPLAQQTLAVVAVEHKAPHMQVATAVPV